MNQSSWRILRIIASCLAITGVITGGVVNIARGVRMSQDMVLVVENYFSFFTIVSTIATIVTFLIAARRNGPLATADGVESAPLAIALATTSTAMIILGVVYNALLRSLPLDLATPDPWWVTFLDRWSLEVLHVALLAYVVVDVLFAPRRRRLGWLSLVAIVGIPLLWAAYTMIRGPLVPAPDASTPYWYPYFFLDPNGPGGYATPMMYIGAIAAAFLILGGVMILLTHRRGWVRRAAPAAPSADTTPQPRA
ncbi:Pr6Pr family membrane protein [Microbacterium capsulatum]|uniref:Pr6Pr family membrane protein n=1 Tax=Microbacterium capsulatum TaxID=3041921 RepID=A0ABU0XDC2_9MICO|nr:Pr6Pr family membrane protein [Microbacterium sp. ASV81]MDQ4213113.1 Pr6Pr family membrane protein [Microbacterium sp. ASV81]